MEIGEISFQKLIEGRLNRHRSWRVQVATSDLWRGALSTSSPTVAYRGLEYLGAAHPLTKQVVRHDSALLLFFTLYMSTTTEAARRRGRKEKMLLTSCWMDNRVRSYIIVVAPLCPTPIPP